MSDEELDQIETRLNACRESFYSYDSYAVVGRKDAPRLLAEVRRLRLALEGSEKARELLSRGMESQCELMNELKQEVRRLRARAPVEVTAE